MTREERQQKRLNDALSKQSPQVKKKVAEAQAAGIDIAAVLTILINFAGPLLLKLLQNLIDNHKA